MNPEYIPEWKPWMFGILTKDSTVYSGYVWFDMKSAKNETDAYDQVYKLIMNNEDINPMFAKGEILSFTYGRLADPPKPYEYDKNKVHFTKKSRYLDHVKGYQISQDLIKPVTYEAPIIMKGGYQPKADNNGE